MVALAAWVGILVPLLISTGALIGIGGRKQTLQDYLLYSKNLKRSHFVASFSASNAALANIVFVFSYWGYVYGAWALFWGALFWGLGFLIFSLIARRSIFAEITKKERPELGLNEILGRHFGSKAVLISTAVVSALAFLFLLSLELNVGSGVFMVFVPEHHPSTQYAIALAFGLVLAIYTGLGGFPLVVRTDVIQMFLVLASCAAVPICINKVLSGDDSVLSLYLSSLQSDPFFTLSWKHVPFVLGSLFSWGVFFICTMDMWQRVLAVKAPDKKTIGVWGVLPSYIVLLFVTAIGVLIGLYVRHAMQQDFPPPYPVVNFVGLIAEAASSATGVAIGLSIIIMGFVAALLSTVDTYLIIVSHSFGDICTAKKGWLGSIASSDEVQAIALRNKLRWITAGLPFIAVFLFWFSVQVCRQNTFTLYMIAGSIPMAIAPAVFALMFRKKSDLDIPISCLAKKARLTAFFMLLATIIGIITNFILANLALKTYSPVYFGLIYFVPAAIAFIATLPLLPQLRRIDHG